MFLHYFLNSNCLLVRAKDVVSLYIWVVLSYIYVDKKSSCLVANLGFACQVICTFGIYVAFEGHIFAGTYMAVLNKCWKFEVFMYVCSKVGCICRLH